MEPPLPPDIGRRAGGEGGVIRAALLYSHATTRLTREVLTPVEIAARLANTMAVAVPEVPTV
jgi:hypothetical protein